MDAGEAGGYSVCVLGGGGWEEALYAVSAMFIGLSSSFLCVSILLRDYVL